MGMNKRDCLFGTLLLLFSVVACGRSVSAQWSDEAGMVLATMQTWGENSAAFRRLLMRLPNIGRIDQIDHLHRQLWVDDEAFALSPRLKVYLSRTHGASARDLRSGDLVELVHGVRQAGTSVITEIHLLHRAARSGGGA